jgi:NTE family protein
VSAGTTRKRISLALQGGGAHGAFTWGVLDALLEDGRLEIEAISGTSAGAMNAVALADGMVEGGVDGARRQLERFWRAISNDGRLSPIQRSTWDKLLGTWSLDNSMGYAWFDWFTRFASPYDFNPLNLNPIEDILAREINFPAICQHSKIRLHIAATNVHTGKVAVFSDRLLTAKHVMASACLPYLFQAVEIDGVPYWDGGYMGNPVLFPLFYGSATEDVLLVQINPIERKETPRTAREIQNRVNEITFNSSLIRELRAIDFVGRLIIEERLPRERYKQVKMHRIAGSDALVALSASSKLNAEWAFFVHLRDKGRAAAQAFLAAHYDDLGVRSTLDLAETIA